MARRQHRRTRFVRVSDTMLDEAWDNDVLAASVRLLCYFRQRWAREKLEPEEGCRAAVSTYDLMRIAGKRRPDVALTLLRRLADVASMSVERRGEVTLIEWPNVAEYQEWARARKGREKGSPAHGSRLTAHGAREEEEKTHEAAPAAQRPARSARATTKRSPPPVNLEPAEHEALRAWCREKLGRPDLVLRLPGLVEACLTFHRGKGNTAASWYATAQTWVRNEAEERYGRAKRLEPSGPTVSIWSDADRERLEAAQAEIRAQRERGVN